MSCLRNESVDRWPSAWPWTSIYVTLLYKKIAYVNISNAFKRSVWDYVISKNCTMNWESLYKCVRKMKTCKPDVDLMLDHRRRRLPNLKSTLYQHWANVSFFLLKIGVWGRRGLRADCNDLRDPEGVSSSDRTACNFLLPPPVIINRGRYCHHPFISMVLMLFLRWPRSLGHAQLGPIFV